MAHLALPPGGDPTTAAWLRLPRARRRAAWADARRNPGTELPLTKGQRRQAAPWHGIVLRPGDAHFLSGRVNQDAAALILLGLNRRERRAMRAKSGPRGRNLIASPAGHVTRSDASMLPLHSRFALMQRANAARETLIASQDFSEFRDSWKGRAAKALSLAAAVPIVAGRRIKGLFNRLTGGNQ